MKTKQVINNLVGFFLLGLGIADIILAVQNESSASCQLIDYNKLTIQIPTYTWLIVTGAFNIFHGGFGIIACCCLCCLPCLVIAVIFSGIFMLIWLIVGAIEFWGGCIYFVNFPIQVIMWITLIAGFVLTIVSMATYERKRENRENTTYTA